MFGNSDSIYIAFGGRSAYYLEWDGAEGSAMVGAVFVTKNSFAAKSSGDVGWEMIGNIGAACFNIEVSWCIDEV